MDIAFPKDLEPADRQLTRTAVEKMAHSRSEDGQAKLLKVVNRAFKIYGSGPDVAGIIRTLDPAGDSPSEVLERTVATAADKGYLARLLDPELERLEWSGPEPKPESALEPLSVQLALSPGVRGYLGILVKSLAAFYHPQLGAIGTDQMASALVEAAVGAVTRHAAKCGGSLSPPELLNFLNEMAYGEIVLYGMVVDRRKPGQHD